MHMFNEYFQQGYIVGHNGSIINGAISKPNSIIEFEF